MKQWLRNLNTARRLRILLQYGWCPKCNSSPPEVRCPVCNGSRVYGREADLPTRSLWAGLYIRWRG